MDTRHPRTNTPKPPKEEHRTDGRCVARMKNMCREARDCPWLIEGVLIAECRVCGYDDTDYGPVADL